MAEVTDAKEGKQLCLRQHSKVFKFPINLRRSWNSNDNIICCHDFGKINKNVFQWYITKADNIWGAYLASALLN